MTRNLNFQNPTPRLPNPESIELTPNSHLPWNFGVGAAPYLVVAELGVVELDSYFFSSSTTSASITSPLDAARRAGSLRLAAGRRTPPPGAPAPAALAFLYIASAAVCCAVLSASIVRFISATSFFSIAFFSSSIADSIGAGRPASACRRRP